MRRHLRIRRLVSAAALAALVAVPASAGSAQVEVGGLNGGFASGTDGWTSSASCAPLCTVTNGFDPAGASGPGSAAVVYATLGGLLGGLATGTSTWTSPSFTWTSAEPDSASLGLARRAAVGGLLTVGGTVSTRIQLRDVTAGTITTLATDTITTAEASFGKHSLTIAPSLLEQGHSYRVLLTTNLAAAALLSGVRVSWDDVTITGVLAEAGARGTGATGGTGGTGTTGGSGGENGSGTTPAGPSGPAAASALRLAAPRVVRFTPGRAVTIRIRATRAGKPVKRVAVTLRMGNATRRVSTGSNGYALLTLTRHDRAALRIVFRSGTATATTWVRVRP
jgi:hypothetical protein